MTIPAEERLNPRKTRGPFPATSCAWGRRGRYFGAGLSGWSIMAVMKNRAIGITRRIGKSGAARKKSAAPSRILDNRNGPSVGEFLRGKMSGAEVRVASAYFSIYAHRELREELGAVREFKFLFGDPRSVASVDPGEADLKQFLITDEGEMEPAKVLAQKAAARECAEWIRRENVRVRTMGSEFLHGKMFHLQPAEGDSAAVCGSSNFTCRGLGLAPGGGNRELNIVADDALRGELRKWFDQLWGGKWTECAEEQMLETLKRIGEDKSPRFVYFLTLYRLFRDELEKMEQSADASRLDKSVVWEELYPFQRDAVPGVVSRLVRWGGCILADSVGLGKTHTALAVMKYFQNENILVLCPKRLEWNWKRFRAAAKGDNPLARDNLRYEVCAHTDLGRETDHDWSKFDLVVIDESHNFRNADGKRYKILRDALRRGAKTKVLMLSATPANTSLKDIRNQIRLMAEDDAFAGELGIHSVNGVSNHAQSAYKKWKEEISGRPGGDRKEGGESDESVLSERLGGAFLNLLDAVSIARSRRQVEKHYADSFVGGEGEGKKMRPFPSRAAPVFLNPETGAGLSYSQIYNDIEQFGLSIYRPSDYLRGDSPLRDRLEAEGEKTGLKQTNREKYLIGMMRTNFLKRLESSAHSFCMTLTRTIEKIRNVEDKIARVSGGETLPLPLDGVAPDAAEFDEDEELAEEFFMVGKGLQYDLRELQLDKWSAHLKRDRKALEDICARAKKVTPERDAKLAELKRLLREKAQNPPKNEDGKPNPKTLVFTAFADTAKYLYEQLRDFARDELGLHIALVVGSGENQTTAKPDRAQPRRGGQNNLQFPAPDDESNGVRHAEILDRFSPVARRFDLGGGGEIDILIATDCISEGQNLQDCDRVVNYDIHWNPVRIIQRFGRVDRIGGRNKEVGRVDFWPHMELEEYLKLQKRVRAGMALIGVVGPGEEDFRESQLRQLHRGGKDGLTADDLGQIPLNEFIMSDLFLAELRAFLESRRAELDDAPNGLFAVVESNGDARPGIVFCLRRRKFGSGAEAERMKRENRTHPHCLAYVCEGENGPEVRLGFSRVKETLTLFRDLCRGETEPLRELCAAFDAEIQSEEGMEQIRDALNVAVNGITNGLRDKTRSELSASRSAKISKAAEQPKEAADFELVSWLVVR